MTVTSRGCGCFQEATWKGRMLPDGFRMCSHLGPCSTLPHKAVLCPPKIQKEFHRNGTGELFLLSGHNSQRIPSSLAVPRPLPPVNSDGALWWGQHPAVGRCARSKRSNGRSGSSTEPRILHCFSWGSPGDFLHLSDSKCVLAERSDTHNARGAG